MLNTLSEIEAQQRLVDELDAIELPEGASSLDFLRAIYRDPRQPMTRRMRAAVAALPFECPKLAVTAVVEGSSDFATRWPALVPLGSSRPGLKRRSPLCPRPIFAWPRPFRIEASGGVREGRPRLPERKGAAQTRDAP
jgi:hypothetical protein